MATIDGPFKVSAKLQLRLPTRFASRMGVSPGDELFWVFDESRPDTVQLVLADTVNRRYSIGEDVEAATAHLDVEVSRAAAASDATDERRTPGVP
ncbi:AbrB/MazE/SpoVT family DNA-binding domain-containing protein [Terrabacter terrigena]|uniref:AbrB/MazE/SpoVT family DNA-binding domain-containing protein n=1 Tax=Terrabacter terrigena TaxID=574718 RepID=A0ABW3MWT0_9MICO